MIQLPANLELATKYENRPVVATMGCRAQFGTGGNEFGSCCCTRRYAAEAEIFRIGELPHRFRGRLSSR
jgi:hypothetical protein